MEPAFGALAYAVEVHGTTTDRALVSVERVPKQATVALLRESTAAAHAKRLSTRPILHFALSPATSASRDLVNSHASVLAASDKVPFSSSRVPFFRLCRRPSFVFFVCACACILVSALLCLCAAASHFSQPCFFSCCRRVSVCARVSPGPQATEALACYDPARPLTAVVRGSTGRAVDPRRRRPSAPAVVYRTQDDAADRTDASTVRGTGSGRGGADPNLPREAKIRMVQRSRDGHWLSAIDIVRAMTAHVCDGNERAVTDRVMNKVCRRVGRLDCILLPRKYKIGTNVTRHIKTAVVRVSRLDQFIDTVAVVVHPTDPGAATLLAELYKAHIGDAAPSGPESPVARRPAEEDPSSEKLSVVCGPTLGDQTIAAGAGNIGRDYDNDDDPDDAGQGAPSCKRPRSCIAATPSSADDDEADSEGDHNADRDRRPTQRRRTRRRAPSASRWAAERTWTDLPLLWRPNADSVDNSGGERHAASAVTMACG
ncbi:hypothetical protein TW95_gp1779 [Pandoravirus inopinatum]|uniref:Uncharacterized protein n=1 Tax=Pandoravirus inopinatum TaxID=1605721 RepID=A0A0B5IZW8_9VIRU|nr:hypothetical protein TW95_gp1779 [Pandoravirus inopinatum]AJF98513.1 hypothetical protein [Pandoravirus inopinatum]